jgi:hypothetical protein
VLTSSAFPHSDLVGQPRQMKQKPLPLRSFSIVFSNFKAYIKLKICDEKIKPNRTGDHTTNSLILAQWLFRGVKGVFDIKTKIGKIL